MLLSIKPEEIIARWLFTYIPYEVIHNLGLGIFALTGLTAGVGIYSLVRRLWKRDPSDPITLTRKFSLSRTIQAFKKVSIELATMKRYQTCDTEDDSYWKHKLWLLKPWFVHWSIMWGFIGLLIATILDFIFKDPATVMWLPSRILGTMTGILLIYGTTLAVIYRLTKPTKSYADIKLADWTFILFLWITGFTGFWLEIAVMSGWNNITTQAIFLVHIVISMELILLFAFSKFAHALYRPLALYFYFSRQSA
jgi:nitrate reductase gamma subunit